MNFLNASDTPPPKDGTLLLLVVKIINEDDWKPTEDSSIFRTIGFNSLNDTGEDVWRCAGWCWCCDEFTETTGEILGWLYMPETPSYFVQTSNPEPVPCSVPLNKTPPAPPDKMTDARFC